MTTTIKSVHRARLRAQRASRADRAGWMTKDPVLATRERFRRRRIRDACEALRLGVSADFARRVIPAYVRGY